MNRLTLPRNADGTVSQPTDMNWYAVLDRLTQYEDTKLEPLEIPTALEMANIACAFQKLVEYEGTGLSPEICRQYKRFEDEAISKGVTFARIVELMDAEAQSVAQADDALEDVCELCQFKLHCGCMDDDHDYKMEECQYYAAAHELAELRRRGGMRGWISVEDRLPIDGAMNVHTLSDQEYMCIFTPNDGVPDVRPVAYADGMWLQQGCNVTDRVSHWLDNPPLPLSPKKGRDLS